MKRILFVDDDENVLSGLRRLLHRQRREWELHFVDSAQAALDLLSKQRFDVVVTDMRMPNMDGATLLGQVRERHPEVIRLVLSGHTDERDTLRAVAVAHQFLSKPCEPDKLHEVVNRACALQGVLTRESLRSAIGRVDALPAVPRVFQELTEVLRDPSVGIDRIAEIIVRDAAMCAKLLQIVNSSFFSLARRITDIKQAVALLGANLIRDLAVSLEVFRGFARDACIEDYSIDDAQTHANHVARLARQIAPSPSVAQDAFMAGLLHEVGRLVLASRLAETFRAMLRRARDEQRPLVDIEREEMGVTYAEIGAYLLGMWGMPYAIVEAVASHCEPSRVAPSSFDVLGVVHVADSLIHEATAHDDGTLAVEAIPVDEAFAESVGVAAQLPRWRDLAARQVSLAQPA